MEIKDLRLEKKLSQQEAADIVGLSLRTYQNYEYKKSTRDLFKIKNIIKILSEYEPITETKGILKVEEIKKIVFDVLKDTDVSYAYLFGSYATERANEKSDVDILISNEVKGLKFVGLIEELRSKLHKNVDLIRIDDLKENIDFLNEILMKGIKIFDYSKK